MSKMSLKKTLLRIAPSNAGEATDEFKDWSFTVGEKENKSIAIWFEELIIKILNYLNIK